MTDKEFKELCEWAIKNYSDKVRLKGALGVYYGMDIYINNQVIMQVDEYGKLNIYTYNENASVEIRIVGNRTSAQIKSIIENLL